jgi:hypothetical protein
MFEFKYELLGKQFHGAPDQPAGGHHEEGAGGREPLEPEPGIRGT